MNDVVQRSLLDGEARCHSLLWASGVTTCIDFGAEDPGFDSHLRRDFSGPGHTSDFKIGTLVATLPGAWRYRVSAGTGRLGVSIL